MRQAVFDHAPDLLRMIARALGRTPNAGDAKFAAAAGIVVVGAIDATPCMRAAHLNSPALRFGQLEGGLDLRLGVESSHDAGISEG